MFNFNEDDSSDSISEDAYVGYAGEVGNIFMIIISVLGIIINSVFSFEYSKNIISIKNKNNAGISTVEKILSMIAIVETFISIFWLINNAFGITSVTDATTGCQVVAYFEIFLNLFDWLILSTSLYQIKIILLNPQEILESGKRVYKYIIGCLIASMISVGLSLAAELGGKSPMLTCFITLNNFREPRHYVLFWIFFIIPLFVFAFGGYQIFLILRSSQYKNDKSKRIFFTEYSYFVITYIISSVLLILSYVINFIIMQTAGQEGTQNNIYKFFIAIVTFLTCATPLVVGVIRMYRTKLFKKIFKCCRKRRINVINENENQEELISLDETILDNPLLNIEQKILENLILKYYTAVSFALGKSKYEGEEGDTSEEEDNPRRYKINIDEILKDLDLSLNDDIKVLNETNIDIEVTEYNVALFKRLRRLENLDEDQIIQMIQPKKGTHDLIHKKDETLYINSSNKLLMLKKIKREQMQLFQINVLPHLYDYFSKTNPNSIICRIFGLYRIKIEQNEEVFMALMYNIHESLGSNDGGLFRQMKLSDKDFRLHMVRMSRTAILDSVDLSKGSFDNRNDMTSAVNNELKTTDTFKFALQDEENEKLDVLMAKDSEFLESKGFKRYNYIIFEKANLNNENNLTIMSDNSNKLMKNKAGSSMEIINKVKKYEFKSTNSNTTYYICINVI